METNPAKPHELVELIVARLKSHPEELKKWKVLIDGNKQYFTKEESEALRVAEREAALGEAHKHMMRTILQVDEPKPEPKKQNTRLTPKASFDEQFQEKMWERERLRREEDRARQMEIAKRYGAI